MMVCSSSFKDSLNVGGYAEQTLRVDFSAATDYSLTTSFFVDDVSQ